MRINADYQVWRCCARDNVRMLNCVLLDTWQDKPVAVAADGFVMAVVPIDLDDGDELGLIDRRVFKAAMKADGDMIAYIGLGTPGRVVTVQDVSYPRMRSEGKFPDWKGLLAKAKPTTEEHPEPPCDQLGVQPRLLRIVCRAIGATHPVITRRWLCSDDWKASNVIPSNGPLIVTAKPWDIANGLPEPPFGIVMPMQVVEAEK